MNPGRRARVGLILCTFAICGAAAIVQRIRESRQASERPHVLCDVVLAQMKALREADYSQAYRHASNSLQEKYNLETYIDFARHDHPELCRAERVEFGPVRVEGSRAVIPVYFFFGSGALIPAAYSLVREEDGWKIDAVRVHSRWPADHQLRGTRL